ncbi:hypothetical protein KOW79_010650 [Hemibagrus wyckioides]|uniref:Uncharacterized protein n=1 Tax=Hemibagrus wyckioides TaxID=337641 RepID=A0A9D3NMM5_9TELE|nr:hypothetical protein KOW79_010639 [Hemibagrus wyckioides]KAG7325715.1 hypothetical protein KOW79_010640 [Hemibagrus wyckioides]KAG7325716.1 hypothetical protein KOW79_010641 [Hemibagrus wyckioides]KAG7325717.1 hypothetical protein KOW79_010642 [Hemibagrus wyckioides]KAG7325718.1 hypothetical protein KOW79_010643 [Hemibagrus wyckioides]
MRIWSTGQEEASRLAGMETVAEDRETRTRSRAFPTVGPNGKAASPSGNRTPVFRVTGGDTVHYTNEEHLPEPLKAVETKL